MNLFSSWHCDGDRFASLSTCTCSFCSPDIYHFFLESTSQSTRYNHRDHSHARTFRIIRPPSMMTNGSSSNLCRVILFLPWLSTPCPFVFFAYAFVFIEYRLFTISIDSKNTCLFLEYLTGSDIPSVMIGLPRRTCYLCDPAQEYTMKGLNTCRYSKTPLFVVVYEAPSCKV
jgi:hypothetical protein